MVTSKRSFGVGFRVQSKADLKAEEKSLFQEDFEAFPIGAIPHDYTPLREYHWFLPGYTGRWYEGTLYHQWRDKERFQIVDEDGKKALEQVTVENLVPPLMVAGDSDWRDYTLRVQLGFFAPGGRVGIIFLYRHSLDYYGLFSTPGQLQLAKVSPNGSDVLAQTPFERTPGMRYTFTVHVEEGRLAGDVHDQTECLVGRLRASSETERSGKIGLTADVPARFYDVNAVSTLQEERKRVRARRRAAAALEDAKASYPQPVLHKVIETPGFGAGKALRFGDLTGNGTPDILIVQNQPRILRDSYDMISCLTAIDLDGTILWQRGRPSPQNTLLTNDVPVQIYDIDGDGHSEVVVIMDFRLLALDGRTGRIKREMPTPLTPEGSPENAFYRIAGDALHICNVRGRAKAQDLIIKDRYHNAWVYDDQFEFLWSTSGNTGHFPFSCDLDGDGRDEVLIGYRLYSPDGEILWDLNLTDHADGLGVLPKEDGESHIVIAAGDEGFLFVDTAGNVLQHEKGGHVQTVNVGNFRPDLPGLEFITITYWRYPGILSFYDAQGRLLYQTEPFPAGSHIKPVNWSGKGDELILFSASTTYPGLLDGYGRSVLNLPDDGHPELCCEPIDLLGDGRDEIVTWDPQRIFIYTQDAPFDGERIYQPRRPDHHNYSNYRCEISLPGWDKKI